MCEGLFSNEKSTVKKVEFANKDMTIDNQIVNMKVGDTISFPVSKKGTITGRVSDLNKKYNGDMAWHTRTMKVDFCILVIRDR